MSGAQSKRPDTIVLIHGLRMTRWPGSTGSRATQERGFTVLTPSRGTDQSRRCSLNAATGIGREVFSW